MWSSLQRKLLATCSLMASAANSPAQQAMPFISLPALDIYFGMTPEEIPGAELMLLDLIPEEKRHAQDSTLFSAHFGDVVRGNDTISPRPMNRYYKRFSGLVWWHLEGMDRYVVLPDGQSDYFIAFDFFERKLFSASYFGTGTAMLGPLDAQFRMATRKSRKHALRFFFSHPDPLPASIASPFIEAKGLRGALRYYFEKEPSGAYWLWLGDPKLEKQLISWCGNANKGKSWDKFRKCLARAQKKNKPH